MRLQFKQLYMVKHKHTLLSSFCVVCYLFYGRRSKQTQYFLYSFTSVVYFYCELLVSCDVFIFIKINQFYFKTLVINTPIEGANKILYIVLCACVRDDGKKSIIIKIHLLPRECMWIAYMRECHVKITYFFALLCVCFFLWTLFSHKLLYGISKMHDKMWVLLLLMRIFVMRFMTIRTRTRTNANVAFQRGIRSAHQEHFYFCSKQPSKCWN